MLLQVREAQMAPNLGSRTERFKQGKELRRKTPREAHADLKGSITRSAVEILAESDAERVPELVPERYRRMMLNPFAFLRGAAAVMATDLAGQPMAGLPVQAGGDSHLMNFGAFVTPEDNILFDVNDFDETLPGVDFTVDLKRLAASVAVAALDAGSNKKQARAVAAATVKAYRTHIAALAKLSPLEIWHSRIDLEQEIKHLGTGDLRRKPVGVGSVGTYCYVALFMTADNEPLFLQIKQALNSVLERLNGKLAYKGNQGRRVVHGQQMMQAASDIFLGSTQDDTSRRQFYIRTLKNRRLGGVSEISEGEALSDYAQLCGRTLARAHARSGDPAGIAGYAGKSEVLDDAIASFAMAYADQTNADHAALVKAKGSTPVIAKKAKAA